VRIGVRVLFNGLRCMAASAEISQSPVPPARARGNLLPRLAGWVAVCIVTPPTASLSIAPDD
jgi:hypothetical protein